MNKIEKLIDELCPDGVEFKELGEVAKITIGEFVHKDKHNPKGEYPVFNGGISKTGFYDKYNNTGNKIIVSARGANAGFVNKILKPYWAGNSCYTINIIDKDKLDWFFIFYYLKNNQNKLTGEQQKGGIPAVSKKQIIEFKIPIPPLPIQQEIVKILDNFTEIKAELEAELKARKKQYEYYREELLTFGDEVEFKKLGEIFNLKNGYTPSKSNSKFWTDGTIPWFRMDDIRENGKILNDSMQHITPEAVKSGKLFPANSIIMATSATIGEHALIKVPFLSNQRFTVLSLKNEFKELIDMKFIFYYGFILSEWCKNNTTTSSFASVEMAGFKKFKIPIPPLSVQEKIVKTLDKFDALVNDISIGLPAEIKARQQQYEYYRNQLLTFKPMKMINEK